MVGVSAPKTNLEEHSMKKFSALSRIFIFALVLCLSVTVFAAVAFDAAEANGNLTITLGENTINKDNTTAAGITYDPATDVITLNGVNGGELKIVCDVSDTYTIKVEGENTLKRINAKGNATTVTFTGTGTLTVTTDSGVNSAIEVTGNIKITSGTIKATADKWTVNASQKLEILGGTVEAKARVEQAVLAKSGLTIKDATVKAESANNYGIYANGCSLSIENSNVTATSGANCAIWAKNPASGVSTLTIKNSTVNATADKLNGILAGGAISIEASVVNAHAEGGTTIRSDAGDISITKNAKVNATANATNLIRANAGNIIIDNAYVTATTVNSQNQGITASGTITISGTEYDEEAGTGTYVKSVVGANAIYAELGVSIYGGIIYAECTGADTAIGTHVDKGGSVTISGGKITAIAVQRPIKGVEFNINAGEIDITANVADGATGYAMMIFSAKANITILPQASVTITSNGNADWNDFSIIDDGVSYAIGYDLDSAKNGGYVIKTFNATNDTDSISKDFAVNFTEWVAAADVYSVDIIWDDEDFAFDYKEGIQGAWDDEKHEYKDNVEDAQWTDAEFTITIKNHSSIAINVDLAIETVQNEDGLVLKIADNGLSSLDLAKPTTEEPVVHEFKLVIEGIPTKAYEKIATVTLTIKKAVEPNA